MGTGRDLDAVITAVAALPTDAAEASDSTLVTRMRQLCQVRAMLDAVLVEQVAAFDARAGARYDGATSTQAWLRSRLRLGAQAGDLVRVGRQLADLPQVTKALAAGEISLEHAAAIAGCAAKVGAEALGEYEQTLLDLARTAAPGRLRVACEYLRHLLDPEGADGEAGRRRRARYVTAARTVEGMVHLQGLLDPVIGDTVLAALAAAMPVPCAYEERTAAQRRADALGDICGQFLASEAPASGGVRPQVNVTVSLSALLARHGLTLDPDQADRDQADRDQADRDQADRDQADRDQAHHDRTAGSAEGNSGPATSLRSGRVDRGNTVIADPTGGLVGDRRWRSLLDRPGARGGGRPDMMRSAMLGDVPTLADGQPVTAAEARRLACDAGIIPVVLGSDSEVLDIGRQSRVVPAGLRRALNLRDGGCRFTGCDRPASWCDGHHRVAWADGGATSLDNMILLCAYHHTLIHEGWRLHGDPNDTVWFQRPDGTRVDLTSAPRGRPPTRGP